ncbi:MAG TPA: SpaA isopeptide-forming pilin-related protein, partial [Clostridia bacterium]|nr:SpaA isopeptide-forming pilin-related protein [Clostridia bacterium]
MKRQNIALLLVLLLLFTNMIPLSEAYKEDLGEKTTEELDKKQSALKEDKKAPLEITRILLDEDAVVEKELVEIDKDWIDLAEYIDKDQAFKSLENELKKEVEYVGRRSQNGELLEEVEEIELETLEKKEGQFILILEYKVKEETLLEEEKELRHLLVKEEEKDYQVILPKEAGEQNASSPALLASTNSKKVTVTPIDPRGSWAFFHVWDTKKPPITGITSTFAYFKLADGSIGFCMDPGLGAPQGDLPVDVFANSEFRHFAEKVATLAISSGGIPGYSFEENYVFAQMYIWKNIPLAGESKNRYVLDFRYQHSPFEQHKETMAKYLAWKNEIDRKMNHLGKISFDGNSLELELGKEYRLEDKNKNLHAFNIKTNNADLYVRKEANTLILKAQKPLNTRLEFWQARNSYPLPEVTYLLKGHDASYQDLGVFRDPFVATLRVSSKQTVARAKIIKRDKDKNSIRGAVFQVSSSRDFKQILEEITSNNDGIALSKEYSINQYPKLYIREKSVPEPYIKSEEIKEIILDSAKTVETTYINDTKKVRLYKKDFFTGKAISGAVIELTDPSGNKKEYRTDQEGKVEIIGIKSGAYSFKEKASPKGYTLNKKSFTFSVTSKGQISGTTELINKPTRLRLLKKDKNTGQPLAGAGFEVYAMEEKEGRRQIQATYDKDQGRYLLAEKGESIFFSNDRGEVLIDHLPQGDYLVVEVQASPGYKLGSSGRPVEKTLRIDKNGQLSPKEVEFFNPPTEVVLQKKDRLTGKPVAAAKIEITRKGQLIKSLVSDEKGQVKVLGLTSGTYDYREIEAPSGYVLEDKTYSFTIDGAGNTRGTTEFTNEPTRLRLLKKDKNTGQPLAGAGFEVYAMEEKEGRRQIQATYDKDQGRYLLAEKGESIFFSNDRGEVLIDHLPQGDYLVEETKALAGYRLPQDISKRSKIIIIDNDSKQGAPASVFLNEPTQVILTKKDMLTGIALSGAEIEVSINDKKSKFTSDEKGQIELIGLKPGSYSFKETKQPLGYILSKEEFIFFIDQKGHARGVSEFINEPTRLIVKKTDEKNKAMKGVVFELRNSEGKIIKANYDKKSGRYLVAEKGENKNFISNKQGTISID